MTAMDRIYRINKEGVHGTRCRAHGEKFSQILGRKVDLNTPGFLSKYYRERILSEAEVQYDAA